MLRAFVLHSKTEALCTYKKLEIKVARRISNPGLSGGEIVSEVFHFDDVGLILIILPRDTLLIWACHRPRTLNPVWTAAELGIVAWVHRINLQRFVVFLKRPCSVWIE